MNTKIKITFATQKAKKRGTVATLCVVCTLFFAASGCREQRDHAFEEGECISPSTGDPLVMYDCPVSSFMEGVSKYSKCSDVYLIKGIVLDAHEYGLNIRLDEDLKGNFPKNVSTFIAWGNNSNFFTEDERSDNLNWYDKQDILIMILTPSQDWSEMMPLRDTWLEKQGDYSTLWCTNSVVNLSDGFVTGCILHNKGIHSMSYKDFQKLLNKILKNK